MLLLADSQIPEGGKQQRSKYYNLCIEFAQCICTGTYMKVLNSELFTKSILQGITDDIGTVFKTSSFF